MKCATAVVISLTFICYLIDEAAIKVSALPGPDIESREEYIERIVQKTKEKYLALMQTNPGWMHTILSEVSKEIEFRRKRHCNTDNCLYKILYYISQRREAVPASAQPSHPDLINNIIVNRFRRSEKSSRLTKSKDTLTVGDHPLEVDPSDNNHWKSYQRDIPVDKRKSIASPSVNDEAVQQPSGSQNPLTQSPTADPHRNFTSSGDQKSRTSTKSGETTGTTSPSHQEMQFTATATIEPPLKKINDSEDIVIAKHNLLNCTGKDMQYCVNLARCVYVNVLQRPICICRPGYTGVRCDMFNLPDTINTLNPYHQRVIDLLKLEYTKAQSLLSVVEATARFTFNTADQESPDKVEL